MYLYHITMFDKEFQTVLRPKIPEETMAHENITTERISFSDSIMRCITGLGQTDKIHSGAKIRVYQVQVDNSDEALIGPRELYYRGWVDDAVLSHEYWYLKPIRVCYYYEYAIEDIIINKYIVISAKYEQLVTEFLESKKIKYNSGKTLIEIINSELDEATQRELKNNLTYEKPQDESYVDMYRKIFNKKPDKSYDDYDYKFIEYQYIDDCSLELLLEKNLAEISLVPCDYVELRDIIAGGRFRLNSWKLIDEQYVWNENSFLYKGMVDNNVVALLYYFAEKGKIHLSCLEVIEECRSVGIGRRIVELFLNEKSYNREDIIVEPLNEAAESFWNAVGIRCSLY